MDKMIMTIPTPIGLFRTNIGVESSMKSKNERLSIFDMSPSSTILRGLKDRINGHTINLDVGRFSYKASFK